ITLPALVIDAEKHPRGYDDHDRVDDADDGPLVQSAFSGDQDGVENRPNDGPYHEEAEHDLAGGAAAVARIGADDVAPVGQTGQHGRDRSVAKPVERPQHEQRDDLALGGSIEFFLERNIHEIEEIEQANPGDTCEEMDPAHEHQEIRIEIGRNVNVGTEQRCRDVKHESSSLKVSADCISAGVSRWLQICERKS